MSDKPTCEELEERVRELEKEASNPEGDHRYRQLFDTINDAVLVHLIDDNGFPGHFIQVNDIACQRLGYTRQELLQLNPHDIGTGDDTLGVDKIRETLMANGRAFFETVHVTKDGRKLPVESNVRTFEISGQRAVLSISRDISERKRAEEALRKSEEKYRNLFDTAMVGMYRTAIEDGKVIEANVAFAKIFGYETVEELKKEFATSKSYVNPERREELIELLKTRGSVDRFEIEEFRKDGTSVFVEVSGTLHPDQGYIEGFIVDNTDRKHAEKALRESEEKYRNILESIGEGYYEVDLAGNFTFLNDAMCRIRGYSRDELMGMNNREYMDPVTAKKIFEVYSQVYTTGRAIKGYEWEIIRKDRTKGYVEVSASLMKNPEDKPIGFRGIVRDVTERKFAEEEKKRLEAQLQQAQKMEAIATLAGGVAHEFNNALMGIMGNIELLKMGLPEDERRDRSFEAMKDSGHRMSRLTDQLLAYAQGGKYQPKDLKLDDFTIETLPILQHDLNPEVRVETHFPRDIAHISADQAQMQMVLSAILANSNEAIEDEGLIKITAENKDVDDDFTNQHPGLKPGSYVCLTIEDDGKGMDEGTRSGIFDPFFTTKFQGRGMGMAAVFGIVKNHGGWIYVDSELQSVYICLP